MLKAKYGNTQQIYISTLYISNFINPSTTTVQHPYIQETRKLHTQLFIKENISEYIYLKMIIYETIHIPTRGE